MQLARLLDARRALATVGALGKLAPAFLAACRVRFVLVVLLNVHWLLVSYGLMAVHSLGAQRGHRQLAQVAGAGR